MRAADYLADAIGEDESRDFTPVLVLPKEKKRGKYHNEPVEYGGMRFDSGAELERWVLLLERQERGEIECLERQTVYEIEPRLVHPRTKRVLRAVNYIADFTYIENGNLVAEDVKGRDPRTGWSTATKTFQLKWALVQRRYPEVEFRLIWS